MPVLHGNSHDISTIRRPAASGARRSGTAGSAVSDSGSVDNVVSGPMHVRCRLEEVILDRSLGNEGKPDGDG